MENEKNCLLLRECSTYLSRNIGITDLIKFNLVKFGQGGLILDSSQFLLLPQLPQNTSLFKNDQKWLKNNMIISTQTSKNVRDTFIRIEVMFMYFNRKYG